MPSVVADSTVPAGFESSDVDAGDGDGDPPDGPSADATPRPLKTATLTPKATANPPTRPIQPEAPNVFSWGGGVYLSKPYPHRQGLGAADLQSCQKFAVSSIRHWRNGVPPAVGSSPIIDR